MEKNSIFQSFIEGKINKDFLYDALAGMFNLRRELLENFNNVDSSLTKNLPIDVEIKFLEEKMAGLMIAMANQENSDVVVEGLLQRGVISGKQDFFQIMTEKYEVLDRKENENLSVPMIGVVGRIASGKGTVGKILEEKYGGIHLPLSSRLREVAKFRSLDDSSSREKLREVNDELKPRFGNSVFLRWTMDQANRLVGIHNYSMVSIDGFRSREEADLFKSRGGILIAITASADTRFKRNQSRKTHVDDSDRKGFDVSDKIEGEGWIDPVIEMADIEIENEGTVEELEKNILKYLGSL